MTARGLLLALFAGCNPAPSPPRPPPPAVVPLVGPAPVASSAPPTTVPAPTHRAPTRPDLAQQQAAHPTRLLKSGPSPQPGGGGPLGEGVEAVTYPSAGRQLAGWLRKGEGPQSPVLVYLHGGFAADAAEVFECRGFAEAGYTIFVPTYRGENGNPGAFEMLFGEVADAAAAVRWVAKRPDTDPSRVFVFGHSIGGAVSALLAAYPNVPARLTGGVGGFYDWSAVRAIATDSGTPFDVASDTEVELRTPVAQIEAMLRPHHAFAGYDDPGARYGQNLAWVATAGKPDHPLQLHIVPGDHFASLPSGCDAFFALAESKPLPSDVVGHRKDFLEPEVLESGFRWRTDDDLLGVAPFAAPPADDPANVEPAGGKLERLGDFQARFPGPVRRLRDGPMTALMYSRGRSLLSFVRVTLTNGSRGETPRATLEEILRKRAFTAVRWFRHQGRPGLEMMTGLGKPKYERAVASRDDLVYIVARPSDTDEARAFVRSFRSAAN